MERNTFNINFYVQKTRVAKNGEVPVLMRVTINGQRVVTSVNLKIELSKWNAAAGKSSGSTRCDYELNARIDTIRARIMQIYREMELDREPISAQAVVDKYLGRNNEPAIMVMDIFREHNEKCRKLSGNGMAPGTVERYETSYKHTLEFLQFVYQKEDIPITDINHKFITDYEFYLKTERKCSHNTTAKYLKNFGKIIRIALANGYITKNPFANIRYKLDEVDRDFLEDHEIKTIQDKRINVERLAQVRDAFVFCCFTGLAFSDMKGLKAEHIVRDNNGALWIRKKRQKTKNMCNIPLLDPAKEILDRYKDHPARIAKGVLLPALCNQKMNAYLAELADICGIKKHLTTHTGRHSFATSVALANGVSIENVAKMLGHSDTKMTRHYARVLDKSIMRDMSIVNAKFGGKPIAPESPDTPAAPAAPATSSISPVTPPAVVPQSRSGLVS